MPNSRRSGPELHTVLKICTQQGRPARTGTLFSCKVKGLLFIRLWAQWSEQQNTATHISDSLQRVRPANAAPEAGLPTLKRVLCLKMQMRRGECFSTRSEGLLEPVQREGATVERSWLSLGQQGEEELDPNRHLFYKKKTKRRGGGRGSEEPAEEQPNWEISRSEGKKSRGKGSEVENVENIGRRFGKR